MSDAIKPDHYKIPGTDVDIGQAIEHLPFWIANSIKYLYRADNKDSPMENLDKAIECIQREKARRVRGNGSSVRQAGPTISDWAKQLSQNAPTTGHVREAVRQSPQDISPRGSGPFYTGEGYEDYKPNRGYEI